MKKYVLFIITITFMVGCYDGLGATTATTTAHSTNSCNVSMVKQANANTRLMHKSIYSNSKLKAQDIDPTINSSLIIGSDIANALGNSPAASVLSGIAYIIGLTTPTGPSNVDIMNAIQGVSTQVSQVQNSIETAINMLSTLQSNSYLNQVTASQTLLTTGLTAVNTGYTRC